MNLVKHPSDIVAIEWSAEKTRAYLRKKSVEANGCWLWLNHLTTAGYGQIQVGLRVYAAHRLAYMAFIGPIPDGLVIDHLCHNADPLCLGGPTCLHRRCVNPAHLEPVRQQVNATRRLGAAASNLRKTHCPRGHAYTPDNISPIRDTGWRRCRACEGLRVVRRREARAARRDGYAA